LTDDALAADAVANETAPTGKRGLGRLLSVAILALVALVGVWLIERNWSDLKAAADQMGIGAIAVSGVLAVVGTVCISQIWFVLLHGLGSHFAAREGARVFFVSQMGKYLPGSVWPVLAQMEFGRRSGTPRRTMLTANILMLAIVTATGLIAGAALLPWSSDEGLRRYWWTLLFVVPLLACLYPRTIPAVLDLALRKIGREPLGARVDGRAMALACGWGFGTWLVLGIHLLVMTRALGATGWSAFAAAVGAMGLAWAAGLIFIPAPAGAGVRDAVLVATFTPQIGATAALAVALASRVLLVLADVLLAALAAVIVRPARS